jgi:hypothetical protein
MDATATYSTGRLGSSHKVVPIHPIHLRCVRWAGRLAPSGCLVRAELHKVLPASSIPDFWSPVVGYLSKLPFCPPSKIVIRYQSSNPNHLLFRTHTLNRYLIPSLFFSRCIHHSLSLHWWPRPLPVLKVSPRTLLQKPQLQKDARHRSQDLSKSKLSTLPRPLPRPRYVYSPSSSKLHTNLHPASNIMRC